MHRVLVIAGLAAVPAFGASAQTAQTVADGGLFFQNEIRPVLEARCFKCHGNNPDRLRGGLALTSRASVLRGGELGPAIDPASPDRSLILRAVSYRDDDLQMPPDGRLSDEEITAFQQWMMLGAPFGTDEDDLESLPDEKASFRITAEDRAWWSYQPLEQPTPPAVRDEDWPRHDLDRFVLARVEAAGLAPTVDADRRTLIRRATYDLLGLPPTPEQVEAFVNDPAPDAYEHLIDALLESPQYGVRWGRHWLDLVRFAETDSYERDRTKPGAWRYRDWVIGAFNADMPYDDFLTHQLAGDELDHVTAESIIATGYLRLGIWDDEPTDLELAQYDDLDSVLDTTSRVMLGMSIGCARCHDHKGDPIPQSDYYRMLAFFRGMAPYKAHGGNAPTPSNYVDRIPADYGDPKAEHALEAWAAERRGLLARLSDARRTLHEAAGPLAVAAAQRERDRDLVAHLPFEETSALVAHDAAGSFHGRVNDPEIEVGVEGVRGQAYRFDGRDDSVRIERPVTDDFTLSIWFRTDHVASGGSDLRWFRGWGLIDGEVSGIVRDFGLSMVGEGHVTAGVGAPETFLSSGAGHNDGHWHHAALTRQRASGRIRLFVDGALVDEKTGCTDPLDTPAFLDIGRIQAGGGFFRGDLDEARLYARALDPREVTDLFLGGLCARPFAGLLAEHMPDDVTSVARDVARYTALDRPRRDMIEVLRVKEPGPTAMDTFVLVRGNPHAPAAVVSPGYPRILDESEAAVPAPAPEARTSGRRRALAAWITDPSNLRAARVMANRLWQYHFSRPIVPTPNDFGKFGLEPTHPELLDWLAVELIEGDWTLKRMHRLLMTSRTYRLASVPSDAGAASPSGAATDVDPQNRLWSRFPMRRLGAEEIRDSILAVNGSINLSLGGPGVYPPMPEEVLATASRPDAAWGHSSPEDAARRSVYIHVKRSLLTPFLDTFDLADTDATCPVRFVTTQPTQALTMLNSDFMSDQSRILAERLRREVGSSLPDRVTRALELATTRHPIDADVSEGVALIRALQGDGFDEDGAVAAYCLLVLNLNEFVYLD